MNTTVIHAQQTASVGAQQTLRGGSSVFVRVISDNGGGNYTVSFMNSRFDVKSMRQLSAGQTFRAVIEPSSDGTVHLVPQDGGAMEGMSAVLSDGTPGAALSSYLVAQGLVPDEATVQTMKFLQQGGMKTDSTLMRKAQSIAARFPGSEKKAAEAAILLLEDGIEPDDAMIKELLMETDAYTGGGDGKHGDGPQHDASGGQHGDGPQHDASGGKHGDAPQHDDGTRFDGAFFLHELYDGCGDAGMLALANQMSAGKRHWIMLPYEWNLGQKNEVGRGLIRVLIDTDEKKVEKVAINCNTQMKNYFFVLYYNASKVKEVRFCTLPPLLPSSFFQEELRLGELLRSGMNLDSPVTVTYSPSALTSGLCTDETPPAFFDGDA